MVALLLFVVLVIVIVVGRGGWWCVCTPALVMFYEDVAVVQVKMYGGGFVADFAVRGVVAAFFFSREALLHSTVTSGTFGKRVVFLLLSFFRRCRYCHRHCRPLPAVAHRCHPSLLLRGSYH